MAMNINAYRAAEIIQSRFQWDEEGERVVGCKDRYMSDLLGSDWGSRYGCGVLGTLPVQRFYEIVRERAEHIYGPLPF